LEKCREHFKDVVEGWTLVSIKKNLPIPVLGKYKIEETKELT